MTTIVASEDFIAADGLRCAGDTIEGLDSRKIVVERGVVYALCGASVMRGPLIKWHQAGADPDKLPKCGYEGGWALVVIDRDGIRRYTDKCPYADPARYPYVDGSGYQYALGAVKAGADPAEAVRIACECDVHSGGEVQVVDIAEALAREPVREAAE